MALLSNNFVEQQKQIEIGLACLDEMQEAFHERNFEDVKLCIDDLLQAINIIQSLRQKELNKIKLLEVVEEMRSKGINIDFAVKKKNAASAPTLTAKM